MDYRQIEVIRKRGYFNAADEAYAQLESLYFDYVGEIYLRD